MDIAIKMKHTCECKNCTHRQSRTLALAEANKKKLLPVLALDKPTHSLGYTHHFKMMEVLSDEIENAMIARRDENSSRSFYGGRSLGLLKVLVGHTLSRGMVAGRG